MNTVLLTTMQVQLASQVPGMRPEIFAIEYNWCVWLVGTYEPTPFKAHLHQIREQ